jgi:hypothetical protein
MKLKKHNSRSFSYDILNKLLDLLFHLRMHPENFSYGMFGCISLFSHHMALHKMAVS